MSLTMAAKISSFGRVCLLSSVTAKVYDIKNQEGAHSWGRCSVAKFRSSSRKRLRSGMSSGNWRGLRRFGGLDGIGLFTCWCQRGPTNVEKDETGVSGVGLQRDVANKVGSSGQVEAFSKLPTVPLGNGEVAYTMFIFWAGFHIPLGLGGLTIVAKVLPQQFLDLQTQAMSLVFVQVLELVGTEWLIRSTLQPFGPLPDFLSFRFSEVWGDRGWLQASVVGLLVLLVGVSAIAGLNQDVSSSEASNAPSALTSLLISTPLSGLAIYVAYCILTPCIEEYVYRGFLLSFVGTHTRWPLAVIVSALLFSVSHFPQSGFLSLFWIGCCLGTAYTWNGNLATSFVIHSLYNALVLTKALLS